MTVPGDDEIEISDSNFSRAVVIGFLAGIPAMALLMMALIGLGSGDFWAEQWPAALWAGFVGGGFAGGVIMVGYLGHRAEAAGRADRAGMRKPA